MIFKVNSLHSRRNPDFPLRTFNVFPTNDANPVPQPSLLISGEPLLYRRLHLNVASGVGGLNPRGRAARYQPPARHYLGGGLFGWLCWRAI
jgi:hypothetical protein